MSQTDEQDEPCVHDWEFHHTYDECRKCGLRKPV